MTLQFIPLEVEWISGSIGVRSQMSFDQWNVSKSDSAQALSLGLESLHFYFTLLQFRYRQETYVPGSLLVLGGRETHGADWTQPHSSQAGTV